MNEKQDLWFKSLAGDSGLDNADPLVAEARSLRQAILDKEALQDSFFEAADDTVDSEGVTPNPEQIEAFMRRAEEEGLIQSPPKRSLRPYFAIAASLLLVAVLVPLLWQTEPSVPDDLIEMSVVVPQSTVNADPSAFAAELRQALGGHVRSWKQQAMAGNRLRIQAEIGVPDVKNPALKNSALKNTALQSAGLIWPKDGHLEIVISPLSPSQSGHKLQPTVPQ